jgi:hypothetical protein
MLALLGYYKYIGWEAVLAISIFYLFISGLIIELEEIKNKEKIKSLLSLKIEKIEKLIVSTVQRLDSDTRIKERLNKRKKEVIEWLNKL